MVLLRRLLLGSNFPRFRDRKLVKICVCSAGGALPCLPHRVGLRTYSSANSGEGDIRDKIVRSPFPDIHLRDSTIDELLLTNVEKWPDCVAVECAVTGKGYTFNQLRILSGRFAASLKKEGFRPGDVLSIVLPNIPDYAVVLLGALQAGMIVSPINPTYTPYELIHHFEDNGALVAVTSTDVSPKLNQVEKEIQSKTNSVYSIKKILVRLNANDSLPAGSLNYEDMISDKVTHCDIQSTRQPDDVAIFLYSSGTTGLPKAVQLTHKNIVSNILQSEDYNIGYLRSTEGDYQERLVAYLPFFHIYGLAAILLRSIFHGCKVITMLQFEKGQFLDILKHHNLTVLHTVPPVVLWLGSCETITANNLASVKTIICGGAPQELADNEAVLAKKKHIRFCQVYGATETSPLAFMTPLDKNDFSMLLPVSNTTVKILKTDGSLAAPNERGEICIKGPQVMKGYLNKPELTKEVIDAEKFYHSGDVGWYSKEGVFTITDRIKELIKVKGFQVPPAELEAILRSHPGVIESAVIGIPDARAGERPLAFVVRNANAASKVDEETLKNFVAQKVSPYKRLAVICFVDSIPKTQAGKILRQVLKEEYTKSRT